MKAALCGRNAWCQRKHRGNTKREKRLSDHEDLLGLSKNGPSARAIASCPDALRAAITATPSRSDDGRDATGKPIAGACAAGAANAGHLSNQHHQDEDHRDQDHRVRAQDDREEEGQAPRPGLEAWGRSVRRLVPDWERPASLPRA
jgi:hypothetical protein